MKQCCNEKLRNAAEVGRTRRKAPSDVRVISCAPTTTGFAGRDKPTSLRFAHAGSRLLRSSTSSFLIESIASFSITSFTMRRSAVLSPGSQMPRFTRRSSVSVTTVSRAPLMPCVSTHYLLLLPRAVGMRLHCLGTCAPIAHGLHMRPAEWTALSRTPPRQRSIPP